mmetsp:Transcript_48140/g.75188  ORF Transcript_48140/g.75188 Transcript_48140/m.75188 type:complete len:211 (+) Transcript_48140:684-1316(+)
MENIPRELVTNAMGPTLPIPVLSIRKRGMTTQTPGEILGEKPRWRWVSLIGQPPPLDPYADKALQAGKGGGNFKLKSARVVRQPGDGNCLFHSMSYGIQGANAGSLRREIANFIKANPNLEIADTPMKDWVKWDSGTSVAEYANRMAVTGWGGGIEMAACSHCRRVNVHVYERGPYGSYKRISCFDAPSARATVHVLYCGGVHYDALVPN